MEVLITEEYYGEDWGNGDGCSLSEESIKVSFEGESRSYRVYEDEPEDMKFGRSLQGVGSIKAMIEMAWRCGQDNIPLLIEYKEEREDEDENE